MAPVAAVAGGDRTDGTAHVGVLAAAAQHAAGHGQLARRGVEGARGVAGITGDLVGQRQGGGARFAGRGGGAVVVPHRPMDHVIAPADARHATAPLLRKDHRQRALRRRREAFYLCRDGAVQGTVAERTAVVAERRGGRVRVGVGQHGRQRRRQATGGGVEAVAAVAE